MSERRTGKKIPTASGNATARDCGACRVVLEPPEGAGAEVGGGERRQRHARGYRNCTGRPRASSRASAACRNSLR